MKTETDIVIEQLQAIKFGIDIQFRNSGTSWPKPWRARLIANKNERDDFRIVTYGDSLLSCVKLLLEAYQSRSAEFMKL